MAFSYSLLLALLLLFPGLCFWFGWRVGQRTDLLSPSPEAPNSTLTLFMIVLGTICGHVLGTSLFAVQAAWCSAGLPCRAISYDPNIYRVMVKGASSAGDAPDLAFEWWLIFILIIGLVVGRFAEWVSRRDSVSNRFDDISFAWLAPAVKAVKRGDSFVIAYVVTKMSHDGAFVAYEGTVQQLALGEDQSVKLIILADADRFLVRITPDGLERVAAPKSPLPQLHVAGDEISNIVFEVVKAPEADVAAAAAVTMKSARLP